MRVYLSKPRDHWISPYTMLDYAFFWTDWSKCSRNRRATISLDDQEKYVEHPEWVDEWAKRLTPISRAIQWVLDLVHPEIKYIKINKWDSWSIDYTLNPIILPMLQQLRKDTQGSPMVDDEDVPEHLRSTSAPPKENEWDIDDNHHARWKWVLDEMIFAFNSKVDESWEDQYRSGKIDFVSVPVDRDGNPVPKGQHTHYRMDKGPEHTYQCDYEGMKVVEDRIQNGFRLFGKYYQALWS